ncbi:MAG: hypothetical protein K6C12_09525 [Oscillospiraceae bacterium]|nr:hypothetical protein [Oscillospiraceae bacterium]
MSTSSIDKAHGGAILFRNKTAGAYATVSGCAFENCESHGTDRHGGAIHSEVNTLTIQSSANNRTSFVNCYAVGNGGAIYSKAGSGTNQGTFISNCTFDGHESYSRTNPDGTTYDYTFDEPNKNASNGGAIYIESGLLSITGTTIRDCSVTNSGGAIFMSGADKTNPTLSLADTAKPNMIQNCSAAYYGGAVYLSKGTKTKGSEMVLSDGSTIIGNRAGIAGAGIYLDEGTKLNISGKPNFGGTGTDANGNPITSATDAQGNTIATGNFVTMTGYADKLNGTVKYGSNDIREDIYIEGYIGTQGDNPIPATSLNVTGQITSGEGTIWVWAEVPTTPDENNHYHELRQFATFTVTPNENTLKAFRNAVPDDITENGTDSYLTGTVEGDLTAPQTGGYIYWNGIAGTRKVILRKVNKDYNSLSGKTFNIYKGSSAPYNYKAPGATAAVALSGLRSLNSGVFWIGNLPYGWYIVEETETGTASKYFFLVVTAKGTYGTIDADGNNVVDGYNSRTAAETRAKAVYDANK